MNLYSVRLHVNEALPVFSPTFKHALRMRFPFVYLAFVEMSSALTHLPNDNRGRPGKGPALFAGLATHHLLTHCCFLPSLHLPTGNVSSPVGTMM